MFRVLLLSFTILFLSGCQSLIETNVNLSDLQSKRNKNINGDLYIQVAGCNHYADSRRLSDSVIKSQQTIPYIFKDAQYIECFTKDFLSYAHFSLPMIINHSDNLVSNDYVQIISNKDSMLSVGVPPSIKQKMDRVKQESFGMNDLELKVQINIKNDLHNSLQFYVISSYINNIPSIYNGYNVDPNIIFSIRLSDVSVDTALENGISAVLNYKE